MGMSLAEEYLAAVHAEDLDRLMRLFAPDAEVHSPLYGVLRPEELYSRLFAETSRAVPTLRRVFRDGDEAIAFWFDYAWTLGTGENATANAVNVAELNTEGLIERLYIIYDTRTLGPTFTEQATRP